jgi:hypothetical protein
MPLTDKQTLFVREYLVDLSPADAYLRAGYQVASREVAWKASNRLLKNVEVLRAIDEPQCERMERLDLDADWVIARFRLVYLRAMQDRDYSSALKALDHIARHLGLYARDNSQRRPTAEEADRMKAELEKLGLDLTRVNAPPHLQERSRTDGRSAIVFVADSLAALFRWRRCNGFTCPRAGKLPTLSATMEPALTSCVNKKTATWHPELREFLPKRFPAELDKTEPTGYGIQTLKWS